MMTIEEKAKAYDEAFEKAKKRVTTEPQDHTDAVLKDIFPQLKESEDERLRKLLVWQVYRNIEDETNDLARSVYDGIKGHDPDLEESIEDWKKCLAYLEKQNDANKEYWRGYREGKQEILDKYAEIERQKEQINEYEIIKKHITEDSLSGEVNKRLKECGWYVTDEKPAEWSEEDENKLHQVMEILLADKTIALQENPYCKALHRAYDELLDWLKSLRPQSQWKPSKEQMRFLLAVINDPNNIGAESCYMTIKSLYNDLKKLM